MGSTVSSYVEATIASVKSIVSILLFFLLCVQSHSQENLTLASKEHNTFCSEINGELWIASSGTGFNRYRGIDTKHYLLNDSISGLLGTFIQSPLFDDGDGKYWTSTYENLCFFDTKIDKFYCFQITLENKKVNEGYHIFHHDSVEKKLWLRAGGRLIIWDILKNKIFKELGLTQANSFLFTQDTLYGAPWHYSPGIEFWVNKHGSHWEKKKIQFTECPHLKRNIIQILKNDNGIWLLTSQSIIKFNVEAPCASIEYKYPYSTPPNFGPCTLTDGTIWLGGEKQGLIAFDTKNKIFHISPQQLNIEPDEICGTHDNQLILSDYQKGIQIIDASAAYINIDSPLPPLKYLRTAHDLTVCIDDKKFLFIEDKEKIQKIDLNSKLKEDVPITGLEILSSQQIIISGIRNFYIYNTHSQQWLAKKSEGNSSIQRLQIKNDRIGVISTNTLQWYDTIHFQKIITSEFNPYKESTIRVIHYDDDLQVLAINSSDVVVMKDHKVQKITLGSYINDGVYDKEKDQYYIATNNGLFIIKKDFTFDYIKEHEFIDKRPIYHITYQRDWIYFSTDKKVGRYNLDTKQLEFIPSIHSESKPLFGIHLDTIVYVTDQMHKAKIDEVFTYKATHPLQIDYFKVNDKIIDSNAGPLDFHHTENNVTFMAFVLNWHVSPSSLIKYKIEPLSDEWKIIKSGTPVSFSYLSPNSYKLRIRAIFPNGTYSEEKIIFFKINAVWYSTTWFKLMIVVAFAMALFGLYKYRILQIEEKYKLQNKIDNLQKSALQAQMNPHFIFNCLNSIQQFIMSNDKENAMEYLSMFAKLIRLYLHASTNDKIPLADEINMLTQYMELEKLRFGNIFTITVSCDPNIDPIATKIPPMLVQPFVENAILHGIKSRKDNKGQISVLFQKMGRHLSITIEDNGKGFDKNKASQKTSSYGMSITQKRIAHIQNSKKDNYQLDIQSNESGTKVLIELPIY